LGERASLSCVPLALPRLRFFSLYQAMSIKNGVVVAYGQFDFFVAGTPSAPEVVGNYTNVTNGTIRLIKSSF
jgi:hypothetical protein